jgi:heme/copper-type cytochrome/quinol oxidase subunit 2
MLRVRFLPLHLILKVKLMNINYPIVAIVLLVVILLIIFLIRRNQKDKKKLEREISEGEMKPEKHDDVRPD